MIRISCLNREVQRLWITNLEGHYMDVRQAQLRIHSHLSYNFPLTFIDTIVHLRKRNCILCKGGQESWEWQANSVHCPARVSSELVQSEKTWKTPPYTWGLCPKQETAFLWARETTKKLSTSLFPFLLHSKSLLAGSRADWVSFVES